MRSNNKSEIVDSMRKKCVCVCVCVLCMCCYALLHDPDWMMEVCVDKNSTNQSTVGEVEEIESSDDKHTTRRR